MNSSSPCWPAWKIAAWAVAAAVAGLLFGPAFGHAVRLPEGIGSDFLQEWLSAKNVRAGQTAYPVLSDAMQSHLGTPPPPGTDLFAYTAHPPTAVLLTLPAGFADYRSAHLAWALLNFPLLVAAVLLIAGGLGIALRWYHAFPAVALALACHPLYYQVSQGQWNIVLLALLVAAWRCDQAGKLGLAGACVGVAAAVKLFPAFAVVYFAATGRWRAVLAAALAFLALNGVATAVLGVESVRFYVTDVIPSLTKYQTSWQNVSTLGFWARLFDPHPSRPILPLVRSPEAAVIVTTIMRIVVLVAVAVAARWAKTDAERTKAFALAVVAMLLEAPVSWTHAFVLLLLPAAFVWMRLAGPARILMWGIFAVMWLPNYYVPHLRVGPERAAKMARDEPPPLTAAENLTGPSVPHFALVGLFALVLRTPTTYSRRLAGGVSTP